MGVVALPRDVVDPDLMTKLNPDRIRDEAGQEMLAKHLAGQLAAEVLPGPLVVHLVGAVHPVEEVGNPSGPSLGEGDANLGKVLITRDHKQSRKRRCRCSSAAG